MRQGWERPLGGGLASLRRAVAPVRGPAFGLTVPHRAGVDRTRVRIGRHPAPPEQWSGPVGSDSPPVSPRPLPIIVGT